MCAVRWTTDIRHHDRYFTNLMHQVIILLRNKARCMYIKYIYATAMNIKIRHTQLCTQKQFFAWHLAPRPRSLSRKMIYTSQLSFLSANNLVPTHSMCAGASLTLSNTAAHSAAALMRVAVLASPARALGDWWTNVQRQWTPSINSNTFPPRHQ